MEPKDRVAAGFVEAERRRARAAPNGDVVELDGIVMTFTNLDDPGLNGGLVVSSPADPAATIAAAARAAAERDQPLGLEVERGRFPEVEAALTVAGLTRLFSHPAMTVDPHQMRRSPPPPGLKVIPVVDQAGLDAMVHVEIDAFGTDPEVARGLLSPGMVEDEQTRPFVALWEGEPVGQSIATHHEGAIGVFGVGVVSAVRRTGVGSAMTVAAASAFPDVDLVWLHPTDEAGAMYERLGFREIAMWDVWTVPEPAAPR